MFAFDLPFLFFCGISLGYLMGKQQITQKANWFLGLSILFIFQVGGMMLWFNVIPGSKDYMIIPFNFLGITVDAFDPLVSAILFGLEPILMILGEYLGLKQTTVKEH